MAIQARTEFAAALNQLASEKGVDVTVVVEAIEQAALAAFRKDLSLRGEEVPEDLEGYEAKIDPSSGEILILKDGKNVTPPGFARIAAQTAKQVIMQRLHEAEKGAIMEEYDKKVGTVISGIIQRQEGSTYFIDLGRAEGVMPMSEQIKGEYYYPHQRLKFFIKEIRDGRRGPEVVVSRTDAGLIKGLFGTEVPEIQTGSVVIKDVAREPGSRTKIAVTSTQEGVDPVGSLVGQKGVRVQAVMNELGEERIDIIPYSEDTLRFIASALSPAKDVSVHLQGEGEDKLAKVRVSSNQLSLAIGKGGQNVRLAAKLTGYKIDIEGTGEDAEGFKGKVEEKGTAEQEKQVSDIKADDTQAQAVSDLVDEAVKIESQDGAVVEEPSVQEAGEAVVQAEKDIASDPEMAQSTGGDLVGDEQPSKEETAPAESMETQGVTEDIKSDEASGDQEEKPKD